MRKWFCKNFILSNIIPANGFVKVTKVEIGYTSRRNVKNGIG